MAQKKMCLDTWNSSYMGIKKIKVNKTEYTLSGRRDFINHYIVLTYSYIWGASFEVYFAWNCDFDYTIKELKKIIKHGDYAIAYYCDHHEHGNLYDCICF